MPPMVAKLLQYHSVVDCSLLNDLFRFSFFGEDHSACLSFSYMAPCTENMKYTPWVLARPTEIRHSCLVAMFGMTLNKAS